MGDSLNFTMLLFLFRSRKIEIRRAETDACIDSVLSFRDYREDIREKKEKKEGNAERSCLLYNVERKRRQT